MLVLSRKKDQTIVCDGEIELEITVLQVKGGNVKLGITAPRSVRVLRGELPREERILEAVQDGPNAGADDRSSDAPVFNKAG